MRIIFTRNNTIVSRAIREVTREPVSHVALVLYGKYVVHSNFLGTRIESLEKFNRHSAIYEYIDVPPEHVCMGRVLEALSTGRGYDFPGMFYLGIRTLTPRWLRDTLPKANLWNVSGLFICTELVTYILSGKPDSMITPHQLYLQLANREK